MSKTLHISNNQFRITSEDSSAKPLNLDWLTSDNQTKDITCIQFGGRSEEINLTEFFKRQFPKLTTLIISFHYRPLTLITRLLEKFSGQLTDITLYGESHELTQLAPELLPALINHSNTLTSLTFSRDPTRCVLRGEEYNKISDYPNFDLLKQLINNLTKLEHLELSFFNNWQITLGPKQLNKIRNDQEVYLIQQGDSFYSPVTEGPAPAPQTKIVPKPSCSQFPRANITVPLLISTVAFLGAALAAGFIDSTASTCAPHVLGGIAAILLIALIVTATHKTKQEPRNKTFSIEQKQQKDQTQKKEAQLN